MGDAHFYDWMMRMEHAHDPAGVCHYSIAGFIDLLGTKERITNIEAGKTPEEQCQRLGKAVQNVRKFRDDFESIQQGLSNSEADFDALCPEEMLPLRGALKGNPIVLHSFSDTVIIHASLATANRKVPLESVWTILAAMATTHLYSLARGVPARGGIEIGLAAEVVPGEVFGPATYRALLLEERQADWPRVVLGEKLYEYIDHYASMAPGSPESVLNWKYANLSKALVCTDSSGVVMLDLHSNGVKELMDGHYQQCLNNAKKFTEGCATRYRAQGNSRLTGMYAVLLEYLCRE